MFNKIKILILKTDCMFLNRRRGTYRNCYYSRRKEIPVGKGVKIHQDFRRISHGFLQNVYEVICCFVQNTDMLVCRLWPRSNRVLLVQPRCCSSTRWNVTISLCALKVFIGSGLYIIIFLHNDVFPENREQLQ